MHLFKKYPEMKEFHVQKSEKKNLEQFVKKSQDSSNISLEPL